MRAPGPDTPRGLKSLVVVVRDKLEVTSRCLESLLWTAGEPELVVVDNGSGVAVASYLEALAERHSGRVQLVRNERDGGVAAARNQGAALARGEVVCFCDNDVFADDPGWLGRLTSAFAAGPGIAAASPLLLFPSGPSSEHLVQCAGGGVSADGRIGLLGRGSPDGPSFGATREQAWAPTAALAVSLDRFRAAGGFDECFDPVPICEDLDLCCRLRSQGGSIVFAGRARLRHFEGTTFGSLGYDKLAHWRRHLRVIRSRWFDVMTAGPLSADDELVWAPIVKDYSDLDRPRVRLATPAEAASRDFSFFAGGPATGGSETVDLRIGVIGCGEAAMRGALPGFAAPDSALAQKAAPFLAHNGTPNVRTIAVADPDVDALERAAAAAGALVTMPGGEDLIATVPLDGVAICAPTPALAGLAIEALDNEVPVLVEKPAAASLAELDRLLDASAARPGLVCAVNLPWACHPALEHLANRIVAGEIGDPLIVRAVFEHSGPEAWSPRSTWQRAETGAGLVRDLGSHVVDAVGRLLGSTIAELEPLDAGTKGRDRAGATGFVGATQIELEVGWDASQPRFRIEAEGSGGSIELDLIPWSESGHPALDGGPYRAFAAAVRSGVAPRTALDRVVGSLRAALAWAEAFDASAARSAADAVGR